MAEFSKYAPLLKRLEGGFVNHKDDKGGATNMGVTLSTYRDYYGKSKGVEDLRNITDEQWTRIMKTGYWDVCKGDKIGNQAIANIIVDWRVNSGGVAIRKVQNLLGVCPDGLVGYHTLKAINESNPLELFHKIKNARKQFFTRLVEKNPSQKVFLSGWMNRLDQFHFE